MINDLDIQGGPKKKKEKSTCEEGHIRNKKVKALGLTREIFHVLRVAESELSSEGETGAEWQPAGQTASNRLLFL